MKIDICFVHFRGLSLAHLDAAWYSLSKQDFSNVAAVRFLDNNSADSPEDIAIVLNRHPVSSVNVDYAKHSDPRRTHSWSVNHVTRSVPADHWIFFTRSDYILSFDCLARLRSAAEDPRLFLSGWCWQMAYDREARNIDALVDIEQYGWRDKGMPALLQHPYAFAFQETHLDAGVWLTSKRNILRVGGMNEGLTSWGYQQSTFQRALVNAGAVCRTLPEYLFAHQHHYAERNFQRAREEYDSFGRGV